MTEPTGLFDANLLHPLDSDELVAERLAQMERVVPAIAAHIGRVVEEARHDNDSLPGPILEAVSRAAFDFERNNLLDARLVAGSITEIKQRRRRGSQGTLF